MSRTKQRKSATEQYRLYSGRRFQLCLDLFKIATCSLPGEVDATSGMGHSRRFRDVGDESGLPSTPDMSLRRSERSKRATSGHAPARFWQFELLIRIWINADNSLY
jgi:hypothetical protein